ncbi:MAG: MFS transporter [Oscillospiraceae bacterium]|nr:MFS transporter [Oscillospiraceae bacterium]
MQKFSWIKDSIIQIVFITFAVVFTVMLAHTSIDEQYTTYHDDKTNEKAASLARNAALVFSDNEGFQNVGGIGFILDMLFTMDGGGIEIIGYALLNPQGELLAGSEPPKEETAAGEAVIYMNGEPRFTLVVHIDDTPFKEHSQALLDSLWGSLFRGCLMMAAGTALFAIIANVFKKKKDDDDVGEDDSVLPTDTPKPKSELPGKVAVQAISLVIFAVLALLFWRVYSNNPTIPALLAGGLSAAFAAAHVVRLLLWMLGYFFNRKLSSYASQTMQLCMFLAVFLSLYSYSMQNSYTTQIELSRQDELRLSSMFAALAFIDSESVDVVLAAQVNALDFGEDNESIVIVRDDNTFEVFGTGEDVTYCADLFMSAWEMQTAVTGVRGEYKYGGTALTDNNGKTMALAVIRQLDALQADELRDTTIQFMLEMSAMVFAFLFLFVMTNRLLEAINIPNMKRERYLRYGGVVRELMFFVTLARYIPMYFFVLIVGNIYKTNPISWLPVDRAIVTPLFVVLLVMVLGNAMVRKFVKLQPRAMMILGCFISVIGFIALSIANTLPLFLLLLMFTFTGVSMTYSGLWNFASNVSDTGFAEFRMLKEQTFSTEYLGGMAGAVIGAVVYDNVGLFAAFAVSAGIMLILAILIRAMLPKYDVADYSDKPQEEEVVDNGKGISLFRFLFSKRLMLFIFLLFMPFVMGEYFIEQFAPLYAKSIDLSPGAASWSTLLMTLTLAYLGTPIAGMLKGKLNNTTICVISSLISAVGMLIFSFMPGMLTMYAASLFIGISIGVGGNLISDWYSNLDESEQYRNSGYVYELFGSIFGQVGAVLFTISHISSPDGGAIMFVALAIVATTILYVIISNISKRRKKGTT